MSLRTRPVQSHTLIKMKHHFQIEVHCITVIQINAIEPPCPYSITVTFNSPIIRNLQNIQINILSCGGIYSQNIEQFCNVYKSSLIVRSNFQFIYHYHRQECIPVGRHAGIPPPPPPPDCCPYLPGGVQGLSVPFACVGSGDPVRVLRLYTTNTMDVF